jgi:hypothetical protein
MSLLTLVGGCVTAGEHAGAKGRADAQRAFGERIPITPKEARESCLDPAVATETDMEALAGHLGAELILCDAKRAFAVTHADNVRSEFGGLSPDAAGLR